MILDGTLDSETGEFIGDHNIDKYGKESPGFTVTVDNDKEEAKEKTKCPDCGKTVKLVGLARDREIKCLN